MNAFSLPQAEPDDDGAAGQSGPESAPASPLTHPELESLHSLVRKIRSSCSGAGMPVTAVVRLFPGLRPEQWQEWARAQGLDGWTALPLDLPEGVSPEHWQEQLERALFQRGHDGLTGLCNEAAFRRCLEEETERARHTKTDLSVALLNVDNFHSINDRFGQQDGDALLADVGRLLQSHTRLYDKAARLKADSFALLLPGTPPMRALAIIERLLDHVRATAFAAHTAETFSVTVSAGVASLSQGRNLSADALFRKAEAALRALREESRDRARLAGHGPETETMVLASEKLFLFADNTDEDGEPAA